MGKTKCIAFANNKGGSGKTTSCANIGYCLWSMGKRVLLIDGDMQMNLSLSYFDEDRVLDFATGGHNLYTAILKQDDLTDYIIPT
nr:AAA family ATPase [Pseudobutyrivibrio sp.]